MPLSAEDVQPSQGHDLVVLLGDRTPGLLNSLGPGGLEVLRRLYWRQPALVQLKVGQELGVAAEHDVGTAASHVRRDRDAALTASLSDDRRLALVVLRVQHLVRHALPL